MRVGRIEPMLLLLYSQITQSTHRHAIDLIRTRTGDIFLTKHTIGLSTLGITLFAASNTCAGYIESDRPSHHIGLWDIVSNGAFHRSHNVRF